MSDTLIRDTFSQTAHVLLKNLSQVPGCTDRYLIYSERENLIVLASIDPQKANGAFTLVKIGPDDFKTFPSWKMPALVVTALRGYLTGFIKDIQKRTNANL
jgi:hypothetical protein